MSDSGPKRHHVLPQTLLEGFACRRSADAVFAFVIRRGGAIHEANITKIAVEKYFYGESPDSVESDLGASESDFTPAIRSLRTGTPGDCAHTHDVAKFVATLVGRTRHIRDGAIEALGGGASAIFDEIDRIGLPAFLRAALERNPEVLMDSIKQALGLPPDAVLSPSMREMLMAPAMALLESGALPIPHKLPEGVREAVRERMSADSAAALHRGALRKLLTQPFDENRFLNFRWTVLSIPDAWFILGDFGPYAISATGQIELLATLGKDAAAIALPISPDRVLVGYEHQLPRLPSPTVINEEVAKLCREYVVAARNSPVEQRLAALIGQRSDIVEPVEILTIVNELFGRPSTG